MYGYISDGVEPVLPNISLFQIVLPTTSESTIRPKLELKRFNEEPPILRQADPLAWWKEYASMLPQLSDSAKQHQCLRKDSFQKMESWSPIGEAASCPKTLTKYCFWTQILTCNFWTLTVLNHTLTVTLQLVRLFLYCGTQSTHAFVRSPLKINVGPRHKLCPCMVI